MNVCLMGDALVPLNKKITGYGMAVDSLASNIISLSEYDQMFCLCEKGTYHYDRITEFKQKLPADRQKRFHIVDEYELFFHGADIIGQIDIIHSLQADALKALYLRNELKRKIPIVLTMHGLSEQRLFMYLYMPLLIGAFKPYDAIICTSESVRITITHIFNRLMKQYPQLIKSKPQIILKKIPLGVNVAYFKPIEKNKLRDEWKIHKKAFVILYFGRLSGNHKADLVPLLKVFSNLVHTNKHRELLLIIAGSSTDGKYESEILQMAANTGISDSVRMLRACDVHDRNGLYNISDVFVSPVDNIQETFGITPIEAMAAGIPQVVSDWDGYRDTVQDGVTGYRIATYWMHNCLEDLNQREFLPFNDGHRSEFFSNLETESVAVDIMDYQQRIQKMLDFPDLMKYMSKMSRKRAVEKYNISLIVKQIEDLWEELNLVAGKETFYHVSKLNFTDYCHDFEIYPSMMLNDDTLFCISKNYDSWKGLIQQTKDLNEELIFKMNQILIEVETVSVNFVSEYFKDIEKTRIRRLIMYFLKNGLIKISNDNNEG